MRDTPRSGEVRVGRPSPAGGKQTGPRTKIGGRPIGLVPKLWPTCGQCSRHMDFLLQLELRDPLPLSERFRFAYLFMCNGYMQPRDGKQCETWYAGSTASRLILLEEPDPHFTGRHLGEVERPEFDVEFSTPAPDDGDDEEVEGDDSPFNSARAAEFLALLEEASARTPEDEDVEVVLPADWADNRPETLRLGDAPHWVQSDETPQCPECGGPMRLLAQVESEVKPHGYGEQGLDGVFLPFGGAGAAFLFGCRRECSPAGASVLWQCT